MKIGVVGAGTMGRGIGQIFAQAGHSVTLIDVSADALSFARKDIQSSLQRLAGKGKMKDEPDAIVARIEFLNDMERLKNCDIVIEAVFERLDIKKDTLARISSIVGDSTVIGSNTSSISIDVLSRAVRHPERFLGIHFFNPVPVMSLVEIVPSEFTSSTVIEHITEILKDVGKDPVFSRNFPGFISNRILMPLIREAILTYEQGIASPADIDKTFRLGMNHPMGPIELADFIGLDVCYDIMEVLYRDFG
ncbi:MAG: 3-hydroxyacyl-CoA dehydrogenase family protein, partial [Candidatus Thermoplasmatota archaeon]|nr:3-hydroxyacyl-CoA dehydrogenase family protein [Candidatus Thermoplasmatota archaeon]